jgi:hypothetical protein
MKTKMKKFYTLRAIAAKTLILAASVLLFTQCSKDDEPDGNKSSKNSISPPEWIQGYWTNTNVVNDVTILVSGAKFTKDNAILYAGASELDLATMVKLGSTISDEISSTKYVVILKTLDVSTRRYQYTKKSDTEIVFQETHNDQPASSEFILVKQQ